MRGLSKIKEAAEAFGFVFAGKTVLDIGSSTGGFTEYALERGAEKVVAVEKGTNQMKAPLRFDPRVELHEKTDIFEFDFVDADEIPNVVVADVSFVSLKKVLDRVGEVLDGQQVDYLVMLKPQFEARDNQLNKGVVKNEKMRREITKDFEEWLRRNRFLVIKKRDNNLHGKHGNAERFYWLRRV